MNKYKNFSNKAKKERRKTKMCDRKVSYETPEEAYQKGQEYYLCPYCKKYHRSGKFAKLLATVRRKEDLNDKIH